MLIRSNKLPKNQNAGCSDETPLRTVHQRPPKKMTPLARLKIFSSSAEAAFFLKIVSGPRSAAMLWNYRFETDSRDEANKERLPLFDNERGIYRCHTITNCIEACPKELNPTEGIQWLKKAAVRRRLFGRLK